MMNENRGPFVSALFCCQEELWKLVPGAQAGGRECPCGVTHAVLGQDVESRQVDKTLGLAQKVKERRISQEQSYLYDENEILYLPRGVGVVFGQGLPQKVSIAPIQVTKSYEAITVKDFGEDESEKFDTKELILEGGY